MQNFTERLESDGVFYNFYFNRIYTVFGTSYHISVTGKEHRASFFNMVHKNKRWVLQHPENCPNWIVDLEKELEKVILKSLEP